MKSIFDELVEIYKEVEQEIQEEAKRQEERKKLARSRKVQKSQEKSVRKSQERPVRIEGEEAGDYKNFKTLRDVNSNLERKASYIERPGAKKTSLGRYSQSVDSKKDMPIEITKQDMQAKEVKQEEGLRKEVHDLVASLKSEDRIKNARKAFLYSEIFNRKTW